MILSLRINYGNIYNTFNTTLNKWVNFVLQVVVGKYGACDHCVFGGFETSSSSFN